MAKYVEAKIIGGEVKFFGSIEKKQALSLLRKGGNVYTNKSQAHSLAEALSNGQGSWKDDPHVLGGYHHYHDVSHQYRGHIFYGQPQG